MPVVTYIPPGVPFAIGATPCCKCPRCGVTRPLAQFWRIREDKPAAAQEYVCTHCR